MRKFPALLLFCTLLASVAMAAPKSVTITDFIGANWTDELVHYPLNFEPSQWKGEAVVRVETAGNFGNSLLSPNHDYARKVR